MYQLYQAIHSFGSTWEPNNSGYDFFLKEKDNNKQTC